jgi:sortase A
VLLGVGSLLLGEQGYLKVKARLAEILIGRAFAAHLEDGRPHPPWPWADMHPIARLDVARLGVRRLVLSGASGSSMAFGPGHIDGTSPPGGPGNCVLAGHRDSWFAFLEHLERGDRIVLEGRRGARRYVVEETVVTSVTDASVLEPTDRPRLTLVTCWPFGGLRSGPLRYVVVCSPERGDPQSMIAGRDGGGRTRGPIHRNETTLRVSNPPGHSMRSR